MEGTISELLQTVIAKQVRCDPAAIRPETILTDVGITSLDLVEIIMTIEDEYDVTIPVDAVNAWNNYKTVGDLIALGQSLGVAGPARGV